MHSIMSSVVVSRQLPGSRRAGGARMHCCTYLFAFPLDGGPPFSILLRRVVRFFVLSLGAHAAQEYWCWLTLSCAGFYMSPGIGEDFKSCETTFKTRRTHFGLAPDFPQRLPSATCLRGESEFIPSLPGRSQGCQTYRIIQRDGAWWAVTDRPDATGC